MQFNLDSSLGILARTPAVLEAMLSGLPDEWIYSNEGPETWSAYDIVGHLIEGEKSDWIPRMEIILSNEAAKTFKPFDRFAQQRAGRDRSLTVLLSEFHQLRNHSLDTLRSKNLQVGDFELKGIHPHFGEVTLSQLLATWTVHDLNHIAQISRVLAKQYQQAVGPWIAYLKILQ